MSRLEERSFWNLIHFYGEELLLLDLGRRRGLKIVKVGIDVPEDVAKFQQAVADIQGLTLNLEMYIRKTVVDMVRLDFEGLKSINIFEVAP